MGFTSYLEYENRRLSIENTELKLWLEQKKEELARTLKEAEDCLSEEMQNLTDLTILKQKISKLEKQRNIAMCVINCLKEVNTSAECEQVFTQYEQMLTELKNK